MSDAVPTLSGVVAGSRTPRQIVLLLHGLGADGRDLIDLARHWQDDLPETLFVAPDAPDPCDMAPMGYQWFSVQNRDPAVLLAGALRARAAIDAFIDRLLATYRLGPERLALVGFSQGTMVGLQVALRRAPAVAGVVGYSGLLLQGPELAAATRSRPPTLLIHGEADAVVDHARLGEAEAGLRALGVPVEAVSRPGLGHGIDLEGLRLGLAFLRRVFAPT